MRDSAASGCHAGRRHLRAFRGTRNAVQFERLLLPFSEDGTTSASCVIADLRR